MAKPGYRLYTDGSDCDDGVGASAILYCPGIPEPTVLCYHLGASTRHSVYEAELVGLLLTSHLLTLVSFQQASCAADNQACLPTVRNRKPHPAHYLMDRLLRSLDALTKQHPGAKLTLRWIPGHCDLDGNERADAEGRALHAETAALPTPYLNGSCVTPSRPAFPRFGKPSGHPS